MASRQINCPSCGSVMSVESEWAGMSVSCPQCNFTLTVPGAAQPQVENSQTLEIQQGGYQQGGYQQGGYQQGGYQQGGYQQGGYQQGGYQQGGYQQGGYQQGGYQQGGYQQGGYNNYPEEVGMFTALKHYADFSGRARRKEYWLFYLFTMLVNIFFNILIGICSDSAEAVIALYILSILVSLAFFIPNLAVYVRRLHDTGRSGWNILWILVPCVGPILLLIWLCQDSQPGTNQYGPNPKGF